MSTEERENYIKVEFTTVSLVMVDAAIKRLKTYLMMILNCVHFKATFSVRYMTFLNFSY